MFRHTEQEERAMTMSPHHFMVNNKETGLEDVYARPITPKPVSKAPPPPPPRANPPKQKTLKFQTNEDSSNSIYDNPISYKSNGITEEKSSSVNISRAFPSSNESRGRNQNQNSLSVQNIEKNVTPTSNENIKDNGKMTFTIYLNFLDSFLNPNSIYYIFLSYDIMI